MKKCTDRKGVTILMALLLLLVASMVSVVILTAATTAARHISNDRQSQQTYLTVSSAAELLRDDILSSGYEQKVTRRPTATGSYIERTEVTQTPQGAMKVWLERGIETRLVWRPMHMQPVYEGCPYYGGDRAERIFDRGLCLPSGSILTDEQIATVIAEIRGVV